MKPVDPHRKSQQLRTFTPTRKPAGVFTLGVAFCDASLMALAFFLAISPFVLQPGINISLPRADIYRHSIIMSNLNFLCLILY